MYDFEFELTPFDLRRAQRFCRYVRMGKTGGIIAFSFVVLFFSLYGLLSLFMDMPDHPGLGRILGAIVVASMFLLFFGYVVIRAVVFRSQCQFPFVGLTHVHIGAESLQLTCGLNHRQWLWNVIMGFEESPDFFLLLTADAFLVLPRRAIDDSLFLPFRTLVAEKTAINRTQKTFGFPVHVPTNTDGGPMFHPPEKSAPAGTTVDQDKEPR